MKHLLKLLPLLLLPVLFFACSSPTKEQIFQRTALNANLVSSAYRPIYFSEILEQKAKNNLPTSAKEYVSSRTIAPLNEAIEKVKDLKQAKDSQELISTSLDYMETGKHLFEKEYLRIAEMIDAGKSPEEVKIAIDQMFTATETEMLSKQNNMVAVASVFAKENNIDYIVR
ncbi:hypothetical protein [Sphingobacterium sp. BN32]|uniref:hypothetical protein n=1 Tax=Sphingobacterium sp. BN32 TaxID=3058432 RepID=UPI00265CB98A|nr:hypothetical protein [Sphingobacterium sp. BN32]WKK58206.1 hypothetical protein QYC40_16375 [Sphingobacterium sp. BN32]